MRNQLFTLAGAGLFLVCGGCASQDHAMTSPAHPGPVAGQGVGLGVGVVAGNAVGTAVGVGEGLVKGAAAPFNPTKRVVRRWRTEITSDGRRIQVPVDVLVDAQGRPIKDRFK